MVVLDHIRHHVLLVLSPGFLGFGGFKEGEDAKGFGNKPLLKAAVKESDLFVTLSFFLGELFPIPRSQERLTSVLIQNDTENACFR